MSQPIAVRAESHRTLDQRLYLLFPRVTALLLRWVWRLFVLLSPRSRLRRALVRLYARRAFEAVNRGDLDAVGPFTHPQFESIMPPDLVAVGGFDVVYRGYEARFEAQRRWAEEWGEFRFEPEEVIDLADDRFLTLGRTKASGRSSGAQVDSEWGLLATFCDGLVIREEPFLDRDLALRAAGLLRAPGIGGT